MDKREDSPEKVCAAGVFKAVEACSDRQALPFGPVELWFWTAEKIEAVYRLHETAALALAEGLCPHAGD